MNIVYLANYLGLPQFSSATFCSFYYTNLARLLSNESFMFSDAIVHDIFYFLFWLFIARM